MVIFSIMIILFVTECHLTALKKNTNIELTSELDFVSEALRFCDGKEKENFCSDENLSIMFGIENQRLKVLEIQNGVKNMVKKVVENLWNIKYRGYSVVRHWPVAI